MQDLKFTLRQLAKAPGFTAIAVLTLALGIGACTAIFSVVNSVLLRPLDYPQPERILVLKETDLPDFPEFSVSPPNFLDWEKQTKSFSAIAAVSGAPLNLTSDGEPQRLFGQKATARFSRSMAFSRCSAARFCRRTTRRAESTWWSWVFLSGNASWAAPPMSSGATSS